MLKIENDKDLKSFNTYGVGGKAKYFLIAEKKSDFIEALEFANEKNIPLLVLGRGSNVLFSEKDYPGLVVLNNLKGIKRTDDKVEIASGNTIAELTKFTIDEGLTGVEFLAGVPGSIGGAIVGNAGCFGGEIGEKTESIEILNLKNSQIENIDGKKADFTYRKSIFKHDLPAIILSVVLNLQQSTSEKVVEKSRDIMEKRRAKDPKGRTCGSFFKNVEVKNAPEKLIKEIETRGIDGNIPAGKLIDEAGCKGLKIGDAEVSTHNAGFIINKSNATASDIRNLAEEIKKRVFEKFEVELESEVRYL